MRVKNVELRVAAHNGVEVFFELKWKLVADTPQAPASDPHYKLLIGELFARFQLGEDKA